MREGSKEPYIGEHLSAEGGQYRHRYQLFFVHALQSSVVSTRSTAVQVGSHFKCKQSTLALTTEGKRIGSVNGCELH